MLRRENQKRGHFPLDEYRTERARPMRQFVSKLYHNGLLVKSWSVGSDTASNATAQAMQDHGLEMSSLIHQFEDEFFAGRARLFSDPA